MDMKRKTPTVCSTHSSTSKDHLDDQLGTDHMNDIVHNSTLYHQYSAGSADTHLVEIIVC